MENYTALLGEMVKKCSALTNNPDINDLASSIQMKYLLLFECFSKCHNVYNSSKDLSSDEIDDLGRYHGKW